MTYPPQPAHPGPHTHEQRFRLSTVKAVKKAGPLGRNMLIIGAVMLFLTGMWSLSIGHWWPMAIGVIAWGVAAARRSARSIWAGSKYLGEMTIGPRGVVITNPQGVPNVFGWDEVHGIGVLRRQHTIAVHSQAPAARGMRRVNGSNAVFPLISMIFVEAEQSQVEAALRHYAGGRFIGTGLTPAQLERR